MATIGSYHKAGCHICWYCEKPILYRDWVTYTELRYMFPEQ